MSIPTIDDLKAQVRQLDEDTSRLRDALYEKRSAGELAMDARTLAPIYRHHPDLQMQWRNDAGDHLHQVHFLLTSIKGHLGAVRYALRQGEQEKVANAPE